MEKRSQDMIDKSIDFRRTLLASSVAEDDAKIIYNESFKSIPLYCYTFFSGEFKHKYGCPPFHYEIMDSLSDRSQDRVVITAPRNFSKSTLCVLGYCSHQAVYKQRKFIIIVSSSSNLAEDWTTKIKGEFEENLLLRVAFGSLKTERLYDGSGTDRWTAKEFVLRHPDGFRTRFRSRGMGQRIRGSNPREGRPDLFLLDDIESVENTNTPELRNRNKVWLNRTVIPALPSEDGKVVVVGNLIHSAGLINSLPDSPRWKSLFYQAIMDGDSIWPDRWPKERLDLEKLDYAARGDLSSFYLEYMNLPVAEEERQLKITEQNYHSAQIIDDCIQLNPEEEVVPFYLFIGMDPGGWVSTTRDPSAIVCLAVIPEGITLVLDSAKGHWDPDEKVAQFMKMAKKYVKPNASGVETIRDEDLAFQIQKQMRKEQYYFVMNQFGAAQVRGKKEDRIATTIQPMLKIGDLRIRHGMADLEEEMYGFPRGKEDHLLDALYFAIKSSYAPSDKMIRKSTGRVIRKKKEYKNWATL